MHKITFDMSKDSATIRDLMEIDLVRYISKKSLNITFNQCAILQGIDYILIML